MRRTLAVLLLVALTSVQGSLALRADIFVLGDSTATTTAQACGTHHGWADSLVAAGLLLSPVNNEAISGASSRSFYQNAPGAPLTTPPTANSMGGVPQWSDVVGMLSADDFVLIGFGINDQVISSSPTPAQANKQTTLTEYRDFLNLYVDQTLSAGATPILVTPPHNFQFDLEGTGAFIPSPDRILRADVMRDEVAPASGSRSAIDVIDLEQYTLNTYDLDVASGATAEHGLLTSDDVFARYLACTGDFIHLSDSGALDHAQFIADEMNDILIARGAAIPEPSAFLLLAFCALLRASKQSPALTWLRKRR